MREKGIFEGETAGFVVGDLVVDQDRVAFAGEVALGAIDEEFAL